MFAITQSQRSVRRRDFHVPPNDPELRSGTFLSIEAIFGFPELENAEDQTVTQAVPEFFSQMAASAPGAPLKTRMRLQATWTDDGTPDGSIDEEVRWITTLDDGFEWEECKKVQAVERGAVQLIYVPAARDAARQVTALLRGRLWQAARWSDEFRSGSARSAGEIQILFASEKPAEFIAERIQRRWKQVHEGGTDAAPVLRLVETRFEEMLRRVEVAFHPDEQGDERDLDDLSDGQRSLFHIALTAATLEVERDAQALTGERASWFDQEKLRIAALTLLAIEEPENSLSPFFLSRIIAQGREISTLPSAQVVLSSHSPAILGRIEPEEVRHLRHDLKTRRSTATPLSLPGDAVEASRYVRLAVRAHPELYFARFVVLAEGDSESLVIPRIAESMGLHLDPSFVPIVPLGGRYVSHFWRLLDDLGIPYATLLDLDLGRAHGGVKLISRIFETLRTAGRDLARNPFVARGEVNPNDASGLTDAALLADPERNPWILALREEGVFLSHPLDLDFSMLRAFPGAYQQPNPGGRGPRSDEDAVQEKKRVSLKTGGTPDLYDGGYDLSFTWYPYLFINRSKPETHLAALGAIDPGALQANAPAELRALIAHVRDVLKLEARNEE